MEWCVVLFLSLKKGNDMKSIAAAALFLALGSASQAQAQFVAPVSCSLSISDVNVVVGQPFSFTVEVFAEIDNEPGVPRPQVPRPPLTAVFFGTKNGADDIGAGGYADPRTFGYGTTTLSGYANPGNVTGTYVRYAQIRDAQGRAICTTNAVSTFLQ